MKSASIYIMASVMAMFLILVSSYDVSLCATSTVTAEEDGGEKAEKEEQKSPFLLPSVFLRLTVETARRQIDQFHN